MTKQTMVALKKKWNKILYWYGVSPRAQEEIEINSKFKWRHWKEGTTHRASGRVRGIPRGWEPTDNLPSSGGRSRERTVCYWSDMERRRGPGQERQSWKGSPSRCLRVTALHQLHWSRERARRSTPTSLSCLSLWSPPGAFHWPKPEAGGKESRGKKMGEDSRERPLGGSVSSRELNPQPFVPEA